MDRTRAAVAVSCGIFAVALAIAAVLADEAWLVLAASLGAVASAVVASEAPWRRLLGRATRAELQAAAIRLDEERRKALERASRYEAEAIRARHDLAAAMRAGAASSVGTSEQEAIGDRNMTAAENPSDNVQSGDASSPEDLQPDLLLDPTTGAFSQLFFEASLEKRVSAARRGMRQLSLAVVDVVEGTRGAADRSSPKADPKVVAATMSKVFRDADTIARAEDGTFLLLFEDTPETGAVWTLERFRRRLTDQDEGLTTWAGVSCYPAYGFNAEQLLAQAHEALERAREWPQDRIEITTASPE